MAPPVFFLSYSHADYEASPDALDALYEELCACVAPKTQRTIHDVGFRDHISLRAGADWQTTLIDALQESAVFVPLLSLNYFASDICGREWGLFNSRTRLYAAAKQLTADFIQVAPALWLSEADIKNRLPRPIGRLQYSNNAFGRLYPRFGFEGLKRLLKRSQWAEALNALCEEIVGQHTAHPTIPRFVPSPAAIEAAPNMWAPEGGAAGKQGPRYVQFIFVAATRQEMQNAGVTAIERYGPSSDQWRPFLPSTGKETIPIPDLTEEAIILATKVVSNERLFFQSIDIDHDLQQRVAEANERRNLIALVVDTWSLALPRYSNIAKLGNDANNLNCVVVLPVNGEDEQPTLMKMLGQTFDQRANDELISIDAVRSPDQFRIRLAKALARAKAAIDGPDFTAKRDVPPPQEPPTISAA